MSRKAVPRRAPLRLRSVGFQLVLTGLVLVLMPISLGSSVVVGEAVRSLSLVGWPLVIGGTALLLLMALRRRSRTADPAVVSARAAPSRPGRNSARGGEEANPYPPRPTSWSPAVLDVLEWRRLEALVEALYRQAGFTADAQAFAGENGIHLLNGSACSRWSSGLLGKAG